MPTVKVIDAAAWAALPEISVEENEDLAGKGIPSDTYRCIRSDVASATVVQLTGVGAESDSEVGSASIIAEVTAVGVESASEVGSPTVAVAASGPVVGFVTGALASGASNVSIAMPPGAQENDIALYLSSADSTFLSNPAIQSAGYTDISSEWDGAGPAYGSAFKAMGATPDTAIEVDGASGRLSNYILVLLRGIDLSTPLDGVAPVVVSNTSDPAALTPSTANATSIIVNFLDEDDAAGSGVAPADYTMIAESDTGQGSTSAGSTTSVAYRVLGAIASVDPAAFTGVDSDARKVLHFILRAA